ncbi:hypothetical protein DFH06DRAFT_1314361 [Mycena polygramma]|nr:hypothetical protein DFH06DRAFT_1314361 [Mycena polygramma]
MADELMPDNSDPTSMWCTARDVMMCEVNKEAPGPAAHCGGCKTYVWSEVDGGARFFTCAACAALLCYTCCVADHRQAPLHFLREWTVVGWSAITLAEIGLVYQLGHDGLVCASPDGATHCIKMANVDGIQTVNFQFCNCAFRASEDAQLRAAGWHELDLVGTGVARAGATCSLLDMMSKLTLN